jgi:putative transposase
MPRRPRATASTGFYHVINRSVRKAPLFSHPHDYRAFLAVLKAGVLRHQTPVVAYCLMVNHWHLVLGPLGKDGLSRVIQWVTSTHAIRWHKRRGTIGQGPVYQGRFTSTPIDDIAGLAPMSRYVERNAKSAGLVDRAEDWPWSSLAQRLKGRHHVPLSAAHFLESTTWVEYVNATITRRELIREAQLRQRANAYRPRKRTTVPQLLKPVEKGSDPSKDDE